MPARPPCPWHLACLTQPWPLFLAAATANKGVTPVVYTDAEGTINLSPSTNIDMTFSDWTTPVAKGCSMCATGTYRSGDAAPENNECKQIPAGGWCGEWLPVRTALTWKQMCVRNRGCVTCSSQCASPTPGYKVKVASGTTSAIDNTGNILGAYEIEACAKGQVSYWTGATRTPAAANTCQACTLNTYAPRTGAQVNARSTERRSMMGPLWMPAIEPVCSGTRNDTSSNHPNQTHPPHVAGMAKCLACKGGYYPNSAKDACDVCAAGTFRSFYTTR